METVVAVATDWRQANLPPAETAMLDFAEKLTLLPGAMVEQDVAGLRRQGFTDSDILSITVAAAFRTFHTSVADALGVELFKGAEYSPEVLQAFGVTEEEVRTTLYLDRLTASEGPPRMALPQATFGRQASPGQHICWIDTPSPNTGDFRQLCEEWDSLTVPCPLRNLARVFGLKPDFLQTIFNYGRMVSMGGLGRGRRLEAIIGLVVAASLGVPYMGVHHAQVLLGNRGTPDELRSLVEDPSGGTLDGREREVARFCEKLTRRPADMARSDVDILRQTVVLDRDIAMIVCAMSYENFICRVVAGLGVRLEEEEFAPAAMEAFQMA